ncbi:MAG TPA: hypothetical protein V6C91_21260, partial [Coleofasciculaceae cyanobacterium]
MAILLAAAPVISLPVVRIIQDRLLSESRQVHVAEVFLGGLLKPLSEICSDTNPDQVQYDFVYGVREVLLLSVPTSDAVNVFEEVSSYIAARLGLSVGNFTDLLKNPEQAENEEITNQIRPFAAISAEILRRLGGEYSEIVDELEIPTINFIGREQVFQTIENWLTHQNEQFFIFTFLGSFFMYYSCKHA